MEKKNNKPEVTPLRIYNPGDKDGEYFNIDTSFLMTLESFDAQSQVLSHAMAAPGFYLPRRGELTAQYRPGSRPLHRHAMPELMYVLSGELVQYVEDECRVYRTGECCILGRNVRHVESYSSDFEAVFLLLTDDYLKSLMEQDVRYRTHFDLCSYDSPLYRQLRYLLGSSEVYEKVYLNFRPLQEPEDLSQQAEDLLQALLREVLEQKHGCQNMISGILCRFLALLSDGEAYAMERVSMHSAREDYIYNRIKLYLRQKRGQVDYAELESLMHYTRDYLNRIVRHRTGQTLGKLAQNICLEEAARQLEQTDSSIAEIIHGLQYTNRSYFYRIFQEKYGMTPGDYRRMYSQIREAPQKQGYPGA